MQPTAPVSDEPESQPVAGHAPHTPSVPGMAEEDVFEGSVVEDVPPALRQEMLDFANALHGRSSTAGVRWWLGDNRLWQCGTFDGEQFVEGTFDRYVGDFAGIARDRTAEIRARFGGTEDTTRDGGPPEDATSKVEGDPHE